MIEPTLITVNPFDVAFVIHRDRDQAEFEKIKDSIRAMGIRIPLKP